MNVEFKDGSVIVSQPCQKCGQPLVHTFPLAELVEKNAPGQPLEAQGSCPHCEARWKIELQTQRATVSTTEELAHTEPGPAPPIVPDTNQGAEQIDPFYEEFSKTGSANKSTAKPHRFWKRQK